MSTEEYLSHEGVGVSKRELWQSENRQIVFRIPREGVTACELCYGSPEEKPQRSLLLGLVLMLPGYFPLQFLIHAISDPENGISGRGLRYEIAFALVAGIGVWLVYRALLKRQLYLHVVSSAEARKLLFASRVTRTEAIEFLESAKAKFGLDYRIRD